MSTLRKPWPLLILVLGLVLFPLACSQGVSPPTSAPSLRGGTTSTAPAVTSATQAGQYKTDLSAWADTYWSKADTGALTFKKPLAPTAKEMQRARDFATAMHASLTALRRIQAPAEVAAAHVQFYTALAGETNALDRLIGAIQNKNKRDMELALRSVTQARALELQAMKTLGPYLDTAQPNLTGQAGEQV